MDQQKLMYLGENVSSKLAWLLHGNHINIINPLSTDKYENA